MKLFAAAVALLVSVEASSPLRGDALKSLVDKSRRLNDAQDEENGFLMKYAVKFISCNAGVPYNGGDEYQAHTVVYRLCPEDDCSTDKTSGCKENYGDYMVGINTFVEAYAETFNDRRQLNDQEFNLREYAECQEWDGNNRELAGEDGRELQNYGLYIGAGCTDDGKDIKLGIYTDYMCSVESDKSYSDISYGRSLPYEDGGLGTSSNCFGCAGYDNGNYELSEFCEQLYEWSGKCESEMTPDSYNFYANTYKCNEIEELMKEATKGGNGWKVFGWIVFSLVIIGAIGYGAHYYMKQQAEKGDEKSAEFQNMDGVAS